MVRLKRSRGEPFLYDTAPYYDFHDEVRVAHPSRSVLSALHRGALGGAGFTTVLSLSRIAPFYLLYWLAIRPMGRRPDVRLESAAPSHDCETDGQILRRALAKESWEELTVEEVREPISWLQPSSLIEPPLTVNHCLFTAN
jgi:hypothetical protein